ncbi:hypothetical protein AB0F17_08515 [Nonomuraea sp. NPDC026600]|uniref:hypothetical protein n=1 Tax=Nonomuraea sp. NPDC026600 TaxID=3155363 RepID=UPI0034011FDB
MLGTLDWGLAVVSRDGLVHPAEYQDPPVVTADNSSHVGAWAVCDARSCGHQWKLRRRFDHHPIKENADA